MLAAATDERIFDFGKVAEVVQVESPKSKVQGRGKVIGSRTLNFGLWTLDSQSARKPGAIPRVSMFHRRAR